MRLRKVKRPFEMHFAVAETEKRCAILTTVVSDTDGEINIGNTLIRTLRKAYGAHFAEGCRDDEKLRDALYEMDEPSRSTLIHDHLLGKVEQICRRPA